MSYVLAWINPGLFEIAFILLPVTFLVFLSAAAGAGTISPRLEDQLGDLPVFGVFHDFGRSPATA